MKKRTVVSAIPILAVVISLYLSTYSAIQIIAACSHSTDAGTTSCRPQSQDTTCNDGYACNVSEKMTIWNAMHKCLAPNTQEDFNCQRMFGKVDCFTKWSCIETEGGQCLPDEDSENTTQVNKVKKSVCPTEGG